MKNIKIENLCKEIKGISILNNINMELESGKIYGFRGVNGSGKTMLMKAICGLIRTNSGNVYIDGEKVGKDIEFPKSVGVLIENPGLIGSYSGFENLRMLADIKNKTSDEEIKDMLRKLGLDPEDKKKVKKYSLGMKQKVGIAEAFIDTPELLMLDEPFNALDDKTVEILKGMIKEYRREDRIIILTSHDAGMLEDLCDKIYYLEEGKLVKEE